MGQKWQPRIHCKVWAPKGQSREKMYFSMWRRYIIKTVLRSTVAVTFYMMPCWHISVQLRNLAWWNVDESSVKYECTFRIIESNLTASWHQDFNRSGGCQTSYCLWMKAHIIMTTFHDKNPFIVFRECNYQMLTHSPYFHKGNKFHHQV